MQHAPGHVSERMYVECLTDFGRMWTYDNDVYISAALKSGRMHEQDLLPEILPHVKRARVAADVGAHVGCHTVMWCAVNPGLQVLALEPQRPIYDLLCLNVKNNGLHDRVFCVPAAAGPPGVRASRLARGPSDGPNVGAVASYGSGVELNLGGVSLGSDGPSVDVVALDDLMNRVDFLKMDVEGAEALVTAGAMRLLRDCRPVVLFEDNYKRVSGAEVMPGLAAEPPPTRDVLRELGYTLKELADSNVLAVP